MGLYTQGRVIKEYWEKEKDNYPNLTFQQFEEICKYPAIYIKQQMKSGGLKTIMIKYLGKFIVYPASVNRELKAQRVFFEGKRITEEVYNERRKIYDTFIENFNTGYNTYELLEDDEE